ncbi:hypothetical protein RRG08_043043 [Elysia crispata]|uniref:Uncharacterized protein n=1 Tax=Elysia crispata TaxID=231223 RepID=A0AAE0XXY4_9GAST|nr:hypothetical protein RRG08_043043 [Elysia crispata]
MSSRKTCLKALVFRLSLMGCSSAVAVKVTFEHLEISSLQHQRPDDVAISRSGIIVIIAVSGCYDTVMFSPVTDRYLSPLLSFTGPINSEAYR